MNGKDKLQDQVWKENQLEISDSELHRAWCSVIGKHGLHMNSGVLAMWT